MLLTVTRPPPRLKREFQIPCDNTNPASNDEVERREVALPTSALSLLALLVSGR
jgi:hypothetical protein